MKYLRNICVILVTLCLLAGTAAGCGNTQTGGAGTAADSGKQDMSVQEDASAAAESTASEAVPAEKKSDIIILYTNDVHCAVDDNIGYAGLVAYRKEMEAEGYDTLLVDIGDAVQGGTFGSLSKGESVVHLMNEAAYDAAAVGNHEFDYGMGRLFELKDIAEYPYVCCNLIDIRTGELPFDPYRIIEAGGRKIALIGVTTPDSYSSSTPTYFQDGEGNFIYSLCESEDGSKLAETIQKNVDSARDEGADYVILLTHLGIADVSAPHRSTDLIPMLSGVDAVIDGHSHSVVEMEKVKDKDGKAVMLSQTGTKFTSIGKLTISESGEMKTELITEYEKKDPGMEEAIAAEKALFESILSRNVGHTEYDLCMTDENGNRISRNAETNLGDFLADAYRYVTGAEIGLVNGGAIRDEIPAGDITFGHLLSVSPFANELACVKATGQEIADALEFGASAEPEEFGGFLHVSGLTYTVNMEKTADIEVDSEGLFVGVNGDERRVENIMVNGEPIDYERVYTVGGTAYSLKEHGDGQTAFHGEAVEMPYMEDVQASEKYLTEALGGEIPETYADRYGEGRVSIINAEANTAPEEQTEAEADAASEEPGAESQAEADAAA